MVAGDCGRTACFGRAGVRAIGADAARASAHHAVAAGRSGTRAAPQNSDGVSAASHRNYYSGRLRTAVDLRRGSRRHAGNQNFTISKGQEQEAMTQGQQGQANYEEVNLMLRLYDIRREP